MHLSIGRHVCGTMLSSALALSLSLTPALSAGIVDQANRVKPTAFTQELLPQERLSAVRMAALDMKQIEDEDLARNAEGLAPRYAIPHAVDITTGNSGTWERLANGDMVWRLLITAENAVSINLGFTHYDMPEGARLFVYAADNSFVIRPFTAADNAPHGELWTPPVPAKDVIVELTLPARKLDFTLTLGSINLGYKGFGGGALSGACNVDVVCAEGDDWRDEIPAVAVISTGGSTFCTGFMVNNVRQDLTPYFMTARHCGITAGNAASLVVFWNYENSWCRPPGSPQSGGPGDGSLSQFNTGSVWRAANAASDFTLVELTSSPDPSWYISYAGWDATGTDSLWSVAIHQPNTDEKRISFDFDPSTTTSYLGDNSPGDGTHVRIGNWEVGTTEPGSSGSPLFNQDHRVIGQLHGGYASCSSITQDWYGKFSVSWTGGGTPSTALRTWLDPDNTGTLVVDTLSTRGLSVSPGNDVAHLGPVGGPFTDDPYDYTLSNSTPNPVDYSVSLTNNIGILLNGGSGPVTGTLSGGGGSDTLTVTMGPAIFSLPAGIYDEVIVFEDITTGLTRTITHTVEVGQTGFTTSPNAPLQASGPIGGPFSGSITYAVTSTHPTPVDVTVSASAPWVTVNGSPSPLSFTLNSMGASAEVEVGIGPAANTLGPGLHTATIEFTNDSGGAGATTRQVVLDVGRMVFHAMDVPLPINDNSTIYSYIEVPENFCIGDVDVDIDITHTYIGDLIVELQSPMGTVVRLHNRTGGSADDILARYDDDGEPGTRLPDGPGMLADFDYSASQGQWRLLVSDNASQDIGTLNSWSLRIAPVAGECPTFEVAHSFTFDTDPGWTTTGQWGWGVPCGCGDCGAGRVNPPSGYTGQHVYGFNLNGCYTNNMPEYALTSAPIDCTGLSSVRVSFWRWLGVERSTFDKARFQVSNDGATWTNVWQNPDSTINENAWSWHSYDISAIADNQPTVYLRWTMGPTDSSVTYQGWSIDDVEIWSLVTETPCPGDLNDSGAVDVQDLLILLGAWGPNPGHPADLNGSGAVDVQDLLILLGAWGPCP